MSNVNTKAAEARLVPGPALESTGQPDMIAGRRQLDGLDSLDYEARRTFDRVNDRLGVEA